MLKKYFRIFTTLLILISPFIFNNSAFAAPAFSREIKISQPTGESFYGTSYGDEKNNWVVAADGSVVIKGDKGFWYYGKNSIGLIRPGDKRYLIDSKPDYAINASEVNKIIKSKSQLGVPLLQSKVYNKSSALSSSLANTSQKVLVILVDFNDISIQSDDGVWSSQFFNINGNSVRNYFSEVSQGKFSFMPGEESYNASNDGVIRVKLNYNHPNTADTVNDSNEMIVKNALRTADPYINFASFDRDGNGYISTDELHIVTVIAGYEASYSSSLSPSIWSHRSALSWYNSLTLDEVGLCNPAYNGGYTQQGERQGEHNATIGIFCHELGHDIGLPDLYDTDYSSEGVGIHSLMGSGNWGYSGSYPGSLPTHLDAWSKVFLGFTVPVTVSSGGSYNLNQSGGLNYNVIKIPSPNPNEYFLIENRELNGYDRGLGSLVASGGIAIWHIDEKVLRDNFELNTVNDDELHKAIDLEEANEGILGYSQLDNGIIRMYKHYFYNGYNNLFSFSTKPGSRLYNGAESGINISIPDKSSSSMRVNIVKGGELKVGYSVPQNGSKGIKVDSTINIYYEKYLDKDVNFNQISLKDQYGNAVQCSVGIYDKAIVIDPVNNLNDNTAYQVLIPSGAVVSKDRIGVNNTFSFSFTTNAYTRISGADRFETSASIADYFWSKSGKAVLAMGRNFADALSAGPLAVKMGAPILLTDTNALSPRIDNELTRLNVNTVYIVGGEQSVSKDIENKLRARGITCIRFNGADRFETSLLVAKAVGTQNGVCVANGYNYPDALSISSYAASKGMPIVLSGDKEIKASVKDFLTANVKKTYVIGGEYVISSNVMKSLPNPERIAGNDRYETNIAVLKRFKGEFDLNKIFLTSGEGFADALSGTAASGRLRAPVVIIGQNPNNIRNVTINYMQESGKRAANKYVLGGNYVIPDEVVNKVFK